MEHKNFRASLSGKRKDAAQAEAIRYPNWWEPSRAGKETQLRGWRYIAMQILHRHKASFRLVAIIDDVFDFDDCQIMETDAALAKAAGHCDKKTIQRELAMLLKVGLIVKDEKWIDWNDNGKKVRTRIIRLAIPLDIGGIHIRDF